jgi:hypothetical protein
MSVPHTDRSAHVCACDTPGCGCRMNPCIQVRRHMTDDVLTGITERRDRDGLCIYCGRGQAQPDLMGALLRRLRDTPASDEAQS